MLLYCSSISAFAQDNASEKIICRSRLTDALSGEILPFATVRTVDASTITNIDGEFEVIVDRNDTLHLSYVGYHSLDIKASELQSTVSLRPASHLLHDIDVVSTRSRIASVVETVINETTKHQSERSDYLYRQTTERDGETTSLVEARFNACSALSLRKMRLIGGRYSALDKGNSESFSYSALFVPFSQTPIATKSKMVFEREMMVPFYWEYNDFYDIDYDILYDNMRTVYAIHFTPKGNYLGRVIHGTAYIDASSQQLLKFEGKIDGVFVINRHRTDNEILPATVLFTTIYNHERGFCEVQSIYVNAEYVSGKTEYGFRSLIYNTGAAQKKKGKKFNDTKDLRAQIDALADDTEFWKGNEIVKRTDVEAELAKIGDIDDVEESSPTQLMQRKDKESIDTFINNIDKFNRLFPQEKVYLHFDNTAYYRNETIWFKAYVMRANDMRQTDMSKVLYVELLNPSGDVMETRKLKIENGQADGSIKLDKLFISGFYEVRAYTRYMLNWDSNGIFSRVFPVFNTVKKEGDYSKAVIDTYSDSKRLPDNRATEDADNDRRLNVRFFPEGGTPRQGTAEHGGL